MKKFQIKLFYIMFLLFVFTNNSFAYDYYPEIGSDPFYSNLNPLSVEKDVEIKEHESIFNKKDNTQKSKFWERFTKKIDKYDIENEDEEIVPDSENEENLNSKVKNVLPDDEQIEEDEKFVRPKKNSDFVKELEKEEREKEKLQTQVNEQEKVSLREKLKFWKKQEKSQVFEPEIQENDIEFTADNMEYFPERFEIEAIGNAKINFKKAATIITANKIIFNYDRNILRAKDNVVLISNDSVTEGDFIRLDLTKPDGILTNPCTTTESIKIKAKEAYIYSDKIEEYDGVAKVLKNEVLRFGVTSFANYVDQGNVLTKNTNKNQMEKGVYAMKARTIHIDARDDHEVITVKNADLYLKDKKIATIPSARIISNKSRTNIETNLPEFGGTSMLGSYFGPAVVLNVPGGSTLKLAPLLTYGDSDLGIGGLARFRNAHNMTEVAYGTSKDNLLIKGRQRIAPGLVFNYSKYMNSSEWFLGFRRPKYAASLDYTRNDYVKDLGINFSQRFSAGAFVDQVADGPEKEFRDAEGRFRWMTQSFKPFYSYKNEESNISVNAGVVAQTSATVYTTGDVHGLFRIGPALNTQIGRWQQSLMYFQTAIAGQSPFEFDRYRYGRSNFLVIESFKLSKWLTLGYLASVAMNKDVSTDDSIQESRLLIALGPDYAKLTIGYDAYRHNAMFLLSMLVGTEDSDIEFKRTVIQNPNKFGKENSKPKQKKKNYKQYVKEAKRNLPEST